MNDLCHSNMVYVLALAFLIASLVLASASALLTLIQAMKTPAARSAAFAGEMPAAPFIDALKGLVEALTKAPAWFAIFLAGVLLLWMAESIHAECKPQAPPAPGVPPAAHAPQRS